MSQIHMELSEQASELGFASIEEAEANGYHVDYNGKGWELKLDITKAHEKAHEAWLKEKEELLEKVDKVWENPNQDDLLNLVDELVKFIKRGEV